MRAAILALCLIPGLALADGALPDSLGVFTPPDQPGRIFVATNFGMLFSTDDGASWKYLCEQAIAPNAANYQLGAPPVRLLAAASYVALVVSRDEGCTWEHVAGELTNVEVTDPFPDPTNADHLVAIGRPKTTTGTFSLYESTDAARTFPELLFVARQNTTLQSVEIARTDPARMAMTIWRDFPPHPYVMTSTNAGKTWEEHDAEPGLGTHIAAILAIDPDNADRIYFRVLSTSATGDSLGVSDDGGRTMRIAKELATKMSAFLRRSDGAIILGTNGDEQLISTDGARTFTPWTGAPHLRGLAERDGKIYAAANNAIDGYLVAMTDNGGQSWTPLLRGKELRDILDCPGVDYETLCRVPLEMAKANLEPLPDAGVMPEMPDSGMNEPAPNDEGCKCTDTNAGTSAGIFAALFLLALFKR